jgi:MYXO-CTERM domain-containing protein
MQRFTLPAILVSALLAAESLGERPASACAIMPASMSDPPSMATERVLIVYDQPREFEHFIREVRFQRVKARFAFLVPTPTRPEIAKVDEQPFDWLADTFPFTPPPEPESRGLFSGESKSVAAAPPPVEVLEVKRVGSFTAFVLSATDGKALDQWLKDNDISRPGNAVPWLQHFVDLKFYFTAFRYELPSADGGNADTMMSETVRLSFQSPEAYYPYLEPAQGAVEPPARDLRVWTISQTKLVPVAQRSVPGRPVRWGSAWTAGHTYDMGQPKLAGLFPGMPAILPSADSELQIQTFEDNKSSRDGWGDVVLAGEGQDPDDPTWRAHAAALTGSAPLHTDPRETSDAPAADALRVAYSSRGCTCEAGAQGSGLGPFALMAAALLAAARRRPQRASR